MDITPVLANFILGIPQQNLKCSLCFHVWRQVMTRFSVLGSSIIYFDILEQLLIFPDYQHLYDELLNNITWCFQETENFLIQVKIVELVTKYFPSFKHTFNLEMDAQSSFPDKMSKEDQSNDQSVALFPEPYQEIFDNLWIDFQDFPFLDTLKKPRTIYEDTENVHNTTINSSLNQVEKSICSLMKSSTLCSIQSSTVFYENTSPLVMKQILYLNDNSTTLQKKIANLFFTNPDFVTCSEENEQNISIIITDPNVVILIPDENDIYRSVMRQTDFILDDNFKDGYSPLQVGRNERAESVFVATNLLFNSLHDHESLLFYLSASSIKYASLFWNQRNSIHMQLAAIDKTFISQQDIEAENFIMQVFFDVGFFDERNDLFFKIISNRPLIEILNAVWKFIHLQDDSLQKEIKQRLKQELEESKDVCVNGVRAHILNSIQGFFDTNKYPDLVIRIHEKDEQLGRLVYIINKTAMNKNIDPVFDSDAFKVIIDDILKNDIEGIAYEKIVYNFYKL
jgi:hypothetical protein